MTATGSVCPMVSTMANGLANGWVFVYELSVSGFESVQMQSLILFLMLFLKVGDETKHINAQIAVNLHQDK